MTLGKASDNTTLVPIANIVLGGAGSNRTVTVTAPGTPTTLTNDDYQVSADNWLTPSTGAPVVTTVSDPTAITPIADARAAGVGWTGTIQGNVTMPNDSAGTQGSITTRDNSTGTQSSTMPSDTNLRADGSSDLEPRADRN